MKHQNAKTPKRQNTEKSKRQNGDKRKTSHGIVCPRCGGGDVRVITTRSRTYPTFMQRNIQTTTKTKRQTCVCQNTECGHRWRRSVRVREEETVEG